MILRGTKFLVHADPALPNLGYPRLLWKLRESGKRGASRRPATSSAPRCGCSGATTTRSNEGSTAQAVAYLATSPAARALHG